jgi:hypothetical protein
MVGEAPVVSTKSPVLRDIGFRFQLATLDLALTDLLD